MERNLEKAKSILECFVRNTAKAGNQNKWKFTDLFYWLGRKGNHNQPPKMDK